jgi:hypothetical protein
VAAATPVLVTLALRAQPALTGLVLAAAVVAVSVSGWTLAARERPLAGAAWGLAIGAGLVLLFAGSAVAIRHLGWTEVSLPR